MNETSNGDRGCAIINTEECKGCGLCVASCHFGVLKLSSELNRNGYHPAVYAGSGCTGCGLCYYTCPEPGGITVLRLPARRVIIPHRAAA
jgi:NAD-dependent dihydropyrimidine dehydrogenase PreA subunit